MQGKIPMGTPEMLKGSTHISKIFPSLFPAGKLLNKPAYVYT